MDSAPKHMKTFRMKRIRDLEEDVVDLNDRITFKEKRREQASNFRNYKVCDQLTEEMSKQKREREGELRALQQKQRKSLWYKQKKTRSDLSPVVSESEGGAEPSGTSTPIPSSPTSPVAAVLVSHIPSSPTRLSGASTPYTSISTDHAPPSPHDLAHSVTSDTDSESQHFQ